MIQVTEPIRTASIQKAAGRIRSIVAPETIEAAVQENSRNAAQNTPLSRAQPAFPNTSSAGSFTPGPPRWVPMSSAQGSAFCTLRSPPVMPGPFGKAK